MAIHKIAIKKPGEPLAFMDYEADSRYDIKPLIGDEKKRVDVQFVNLNTAPSHDILFMACDEAGLPKGLPFNFNMITVSGGYHIFNDIVGTVVFLRCRFDHAWEDYLMLDLTSEDIRLIEMILSEEYQSKIKWAKDNDPNILYEPGGLLFFKPLD